MPPKIIQRQCNQPHLNAPSLQLLFFPKNPKLHTQAHLEEHFKKLSEWAVHMTPCNKEEGRNPTSKLGSGKLLAFKI